MQSVCEFECARPKAIVVCCCYAAHKTKKAKCGIVDFRIWREAGDLDLHKASMILFALQVRLVQEFAFDFALFEHLQCAGGGIWQRAPAAFL
jgi:hypothetical protein